VCVCVFVFVACVSCVSCHVVLCVWAPSGAGAQRPARGGDVWARPNVCVCVCVVCVCVRVCVCVHERVRMHVIVSVSASVSASSVSVSVCVRVRACMCAAFCGKPPARGCGAGGSWLVALPVGVPPGRGCARAGPGGSWPWPGPSRCELVCV
jgi:hypothetical protein